MTSAHDDESEAESKNLPLQAFVYTPQLEFDYTALEGYPCRISGATQSPVGTDSETSAVQPILDPLSALLIPTKKDMILGFKTVKYKSGIMSEFLVTRYGREDRLTYRFKQRPESDPSFGKNKCNSSLRWIKWVDPKFSLQSDDKAKVVTALSNSAAKVSQTEFLKVFPLFMPDGSLPTPYNSDSVTANAAYSHSVTLDQWMAGLPSKPDSKLFPVVRRVPAVFTEPCQLGIKAKSWRSVLLGWLS